jgi:type VI secretion system protein ImpL
VDRTVQTLMQQPITAAQGALQGQGPAGAESLCGDLRVLTAKYPFNPRASQQASLADMAGFFAPAGGALTKFYQDNLANALVPQGGTYAPKPGSPVALNPAFVAFFDQAARIQSAIYPAGGTQAQYQYSIRPYASEGIQSLTLSIDGRTYTSTGSNAQPLQFVWPGAGVQGVTLTAKFGGGSELTLLQFDGPWAVFEFFGAASSIRPSAAVYHVEWSPTTSGQPMRLANGHPVTLQFDVDTKGAPFIFEKGELSGLRCVAKVAAR